MQEIKKLILFKGNIETLGYFSEQLAKTFLKLGYEVFLFDFDRTYDCIIDMIWFAEADVTAMITFNFIGICGEDVFRSETAHTIWEERNILCLNIIVDHPFYYHEHLESIPPRYLQFCIDKNHVNYMNRFFPEIPSFFLPLAGTELPEAMIPYEDRAIDIIMTGNYTPPDHFNQFIDRIDEEYSRFYHSILDDLIAHPHLTIEDVVEIHSKDAMEDLSEENLKDCMNKMLFIDLYVRFYFRGLVVKTLVDSGLKVHVFGRGWENLDCIHNENLIQGGGIESHECLQHIANSKLSLNVMPWFKDGAHDRIFNTMLNHSVCLTDGSSYITEQLAYGKDLVLYSLEHIEQLPTLAKDLLEHPEKAKSIIQQGYEKAKSQHTWEHRANVLVGFL